MEKPYEERARIELSFPPGREAVFEQVKARIEAKFPNLSVKGVETERNGWDLMITLVSVPKSSNWDRPGETDPDRKPYESTPTSTVHDFVTALIEEHSG